MWCYSQGDTKVDNKPSAVKTCKNPCENPWLFFNIFCWNSKLYAKGDVNILHGYTGFCKKNDTFWM